MQVLIWDYGYIHPVTNLERVFTFAAQILGAITAASIFANVVATVQQFDARNAGFRQKMSNLTDFMQFHRLPLSLQRRIRRSTVFHYNLTSGIDDEILKDLPTALRNEVQLYLHRELLRNSVFFQGNDGDLECFTKDKHYP